MERFDDDAVRRILARARASDHDPELETGIDAETLVAAATEAGFDPTAVRTSIAVERLGDAAPTAALDRWVGPHDVVVRTRVERPADEVLDLAALWLERAHRMICRRGEPGSLTARRRSDLAASFGRSVTQWRGDGGIGRLAAVHVDAIPIDAAPSGPTVGTLVQLRADRGRQRRRRLTAGALLGGTGAATAAVGVAESMFAWPVAAVVLGGAGVVSIASGRREADRVGADLDALLAALEEGRRPEGALRRMARAARRGAASSVSPASSASTSR